MIERGGTKVSVKITCEEKKKCFEKALMWPKDETKNSDRGGGCLHLITEQCPIYGQGYSTAARPVPYNVPLDVVLVTINFPVQVS